MVGVEFCHCFSGKIIITELDHLLKHSASILILKHLVPFGEELLAKLLSQLWQLLDQRLNDVVCVLIEAQFHQMWFD